MNALSQPQDDPETAQELALADLDVESPIGCRAVSNGPSGQMFDLIGRLAADPATDIAKFRELLQLQREIASDDSRSQFNQAMAVLQPELPHIRKNGSVEFEEPKGSGRFKVAFKYAKWEDVDDVIRPILGRHGFSLSFNTAPRAGDGGGLIVTGELLHVGGHSKTASMPVPLDTSGGKNNLQGYASSTSFGSRYVTKMLLNLVFDGEDDDGQKGGAPPSITAEQVRDVQHRLVATSSDVPSFLKFMQVDRLADITPQQLPKALNMLAAKAKRQERSQ